MGAERDRRYRQPGYGGRAGETREPPRPSGTDAPRSSPVLGKRTVSRCVECGMLLPALTDSVDQCPKCRAALHACKQCTHFDPGRRFECAKPIAERIVDKSARNQCAYFSLRVAVERDTSAGSMRPEDARRSFENLFKP